MNLKVIDTHAHYDDEAFDIDRDELLQRLLGSSVDKIITIGCSLERSRMAAELAEKYEVFSVPSLIFFKDGEEISRLTGAVKKAEIVSEAEKII